MNKKNKQYVPICFIAALIIFIAIVFLMAKGKIEEYNDLNQKTIRQNTELKMSRKS